MNIRKLTTSFFHCINKVKSAIDFNCFNTKIKLKKIGFSLNSEGREYLFQLGVNITARKNCFLWIQGAANLSIGDDVFFNNNCSINCLEKIEIGDGCIFGEGVKLYDHNHKYTTDPIISISKDEFNTAPIIIGKNCWISSNVTILKGVTIGDNVIIGAGCLIYKSIPSNSVVKLNQGLSIENLDYNIK